MKIGIDIRATQLRSGARGIGRYVFDLVAGVTRLGPDNEYVLIALPGEPLPGPLQSLPGCCRVVTLPTRFLSPYAVWQPVRYVWRLKYLWAQRAHGKALARLAARERLDVLHQTVSIDHDFFPGSRPACRVVQTFYDAIPAVFPALYLVDWPEALQFVYRRQLAACRRADVLVAISESARRDAVQYARADPNKVRVVYPSVPEEFAPITDQARVDDCLARLGVRPPYFLFCSATDHAKNIAGLLRAYARFREDRAEQCRLVLVTKKTDAVLARAFEAGVSRDHLLFTGFVSDADLVTLYSGATALVSPSLYEGFGLPAAQAMRAGTPVIVSDRSSQPEVVGDAGVQVDPEDVEALAAAMRRLAGDPALRAELSARGLERVRRFDWRHQAQAMLDVYAGCPAPPSRTDAPLREVGT